MLGSQQLYNLARGFLIDENGNRIPNYRIRVLWKFPFLSSGLTCVIMTWGPIGRFQPYNWILSAGVVVSVDCSDRL